MYKIIYYLHNQSEMFSDPQVFTTNDEEKYRQALKTASINKYNIIFAGCEE